MVTSNRKSDRCLRTEDVRGHNQQGDDYWTRVRGRGNGMKRERGGEGRGEEDRVQAKSSGFFA